MTNKTKQVEKNTNGEASPQAAICVARHPSPATRLGLILLAGIVLNLAGCGFHLRGQYTLPFTSVYVSAPDASVVATELKRELSNSPAMLMATAKGADAQLNIINARRDRQILSLSGAGRVREYELKLRVSYQLVDAKGGVLISTSEIQLSRILSYDDSRIIAKQQEEALLYQDMERDAVGQILRRMAAIKRAA